MKQVYYFEEKKCPFCDGGKGGDDRSRIGLSKCNHSFTKQEVNATEQGIRDMKNTIKEAQKTLRAMRKIIQN